MHGYTSEHLGSRKYHIALRSIANDTAAPGVASSVELGLLYLRGKSGTKGTLEGTSETTGKSGTNRNQEQSGSKKEATDKQADKLVRAECYK